MKAKLLSNRAGCYSKLMEFHRAQKDCEEALKFKPDFVKCWIRKGAVLEAQKQLDNALESYRVRFNFHGGIINNLFRKLSSLTLMQKKLRMV